jgi:RNA polymerase sigma-70 factor (ECF subfamily)
MTTGPRGTGPESGHDAELSERLVARDPAALAEAYRRHGATVYRVASRVLSSGPCAEDVVQDVFLRLWERPADFQPARGSMLAWLCALAQNKAIDQVRHARMRERHWPMLAPLPTTAPDAAELVLRRVVTEAVRDAVGSLPEPRRAAVLLAYYQGLSYRQVAVVLGVAEGTAKSRLRLALRAIAEHLTADGIIDGRSG